MFGLPVALGVALLFAILIGILDLGFGLIALAAIGGWGIGSAVRAGARRTGEAGGAPGVRLLAAALALLAWLGGYFGAYLLSLLLRPDSSLAFGERLSQSPFPDWLGPQFGPLQVVELLLLMSIAWYRSGAGAVDR